MKKKQKSLFDSEPAVFTNIGWKAVPVEWNMEDENPFEIKSAGIRPILLNEEKPGRVKGKRTFKGVATHAVEMLQVDGKCELVTTNKGSSLGTTINILALDVATNTGFCTRSGSGVWSLSPKKDESKGMRLIRFKSKLKDICSVEEIKMIVFEGAVSYGKFPNMVGAEMIGVLKLFCEENGIEYRSYMPTEIKKSATGKGNAKKEQMIAAAKEKYNMQSNDDNEADALHLYYHAKNDLGL